ncbi:MAG: Exodeoxyribonuclease 7 large subunit [candidate division TA06 bacterium 32_111]|uniref:Exodeoxyribonuclease 7 large subunit n=2 Tax=Bacteria candidate phyla TaxID=1783234 RepID=A0A117M6L1_UNCT6|nr:MAG: Exodeoxyribonuclease 7 large subunit [candidate division TA06 bacterium 32_111]KUK87174.1 MAG: Exodeoxyribonuclease 7 large subunit [candidate division TA06 bacterium 34_109]HAF07685.1 exodeoxyribonuclease VII large subunit [candidate division WOR-3 bacterium]HCP17063.1 exodeoxyribonuclease VII large subunit [candidate division WOR-3 bacterium]
MDEKIFTVTELTEILKETISKKFPSLLKITGEITNWTLSGSGHIYFSLKDESSLIKGIIWRTTNIKKDFKDGDKVIATGYLSLYEKQGTYQIIITEMKISGVGELYEKFLKLKEKLEKEGLFDKGIKKKLPEYPLSIGIITSETGSVIHDIQNVLKRRAPYLKKYLFPATVQGEGSEKSIIKGLQYFNKKKNVDVIIIARGGGSFEDLFVFNDETLAREIVKSKIPIISAVGHETDFTICDFVSDIRAPTPSAAAEIVVKNIDDIFDFLSRSKKDLKKELKNRIEQTKKDFLNTKKNFFISSLVPLNKKKEMVGFLLEEMENSLEGKIKVIKDRKEYLKNEILKHSPMLKILEKTKFVGMIKNNLNNIIKTKFESIKKETEILKTNLNNLNPKEILKRGYSITLTEKGRIVKSVKDLSIDTNINILIYDGNIKANVKSIEEEKL